MIIRHAHIRDYVVISNAVFEDTRLSFKAAGLIGYLLTKPDDWEIRADQLRMSHTDGRHAVDTALEELAAAGYLERRRERDRHGRWVTVAILHEQPGGPVEQPDQATAAADGPGDADHTRKPALVPTRTFADETVITQPPHPVTHRGKPALDPTRTFAAPPTVITQPPHPIIRGGKPASLTSTEVPSTKTNTKRAAATADRDTPAGDQLGLRLERQDDPARQDPGYGFDRWWDRYPAGEAGEKLRRPEALRIWRRMDYAAAKVPAWKAVQVYRAAVDAGKITKVMRPDNWLRAGNADKWSADYYGRDNRTAVAAAGEPAALPWYMRA